MDFGQKTIKRERYAKGRFVKFLERMEDVTSRVIKELKDIKNESDRAKKVLEVTSKIKKEEFEKYKGLKGIEINIKPFFKGNEYYMFIYKKYTDIRLVGTPPSSVGKYGSDTDNWMWPRHTGDFSMFRVYADKDGNPAEYSKDNTPLKSKKYLKISLKGVKANDYAMIMGYPGSTERYKPSFGVSRDINLIFPIRVDVVGEQIDIVNKYMQKRPKNIYTVRFL